MPHKFGSILEFKSSGNSINMVNSDRGSHLTDGELLLRSGRRRGHLRLRVGVEKAPAWLLFASWSRFKPTTSPFSSFSIPLLFPSLPPLLSRAFAVDLVLLPSRQSLSQLHLFLAHLDNQPWSLDFTEECHSLPFFLAASNTAVAFASPWPVLHGAYLSLLCSPSASPCYRDSL